MELIMFGVNALILMAVWRFMIRKTILDNSRDTLFDLRDEVRATFVANDWSLDSPIYKKLRNLLNGHLRFTEEFSIWKVVFFDVSLKNKQELTSQMHDQVTKVFSVNDPVQKAFIQSIRRRAVVAVMNYAVFSSGFLLMLSVGSAPFVFVSMMIKLGGRGVDVATQAAVRALGNVGRASSAVMAATATLIASHLLVPDLVESYSYQAARS